MIDQLQAITAGGWRAGSASMSAPFLALLDVVSAVATVCWIEPTLGRNYSRIHRRSDFPEYLL